MEQTIKLELAVNEVNAILSILGDLPTKSNAYPLLIKIVQQAEPQMPKQEQAQAPVEPAPAAE